MMRVLADQFETAWSLGSNHLLPAATCVDAYWEPSLNVCTVRPAPGGSWQVQMPDESVDPLPDVTIAWLLWHVTWWWGNAHRWALGEPSLAPEDVQWPGSATAAVAQITELHERWSSLLQDRSPDEPTAAPFEKGATFAGLAAWVTFELTKNLAEIGTLTTLQRNVT